LCELVEIEADERAKLIDVVADVITETPRTPTAIVRFGKLLKRLSEPCKSGLVDMLKQVVTAVVLEKLGLPR